MQLGISNSEIHFDDEDVSFKFPIQSHLTLVII